MFLFIHGFTSSSQSRKAQVLKKWLSDQGRKEEWLCPDLSIDPTEAMQQLSSIIEESAQQEGKPIKLVGSSLGGFYATILSARYGLKAVLINPAVTAGLTLRRGIGFHKAWHSEEQLEFTQAHVDALNEMTLLSPANPYRLFVMLERGDETLDWKTAAAFYQDCHQLVFCGGDHGFTRFDDVLEMIDRF
ncbi:YqiA/YcfP family alpha/beta fold hydrolase [Leucothrix arctica]|uniref:Esterase n=1 Tax=Leucothrix arctica TaxID=1481894 RepID=A0A317CIV8_9GAMM|nr:YqiA/YcfP family alpha/beta fold hydrolase [Leucothrix arctica]PWQ98121.1 hypothetical protein DKT75_04990 [Leucothrix arctica]